MGKKRKGKNKHKKKKTSKVDIQEEAYKNAPHSFVFHRNVVGKNIRQLIKDTRNVYEPFTARNLQVSKKNVLKDFVSVAGLLHVTHFIIYTKTTTSVNMKMCRLPRGPTLTFKVHDYCLAKDVISSLKKAQHGQIEFFYHPLLVMNNFTGTDSHVKLMATMFQNMFPSINVHKVKLNDVKRCVLLDYNEKTKLIEFRHYNIRVVPVGMSRSVKKLVQSKLPNLGKYQDMDEYINRTGYSSESEVELDGPASEVILAQSLRTRGNIKASKSAVKLSELGPRLTLQLVKIEEGICEGNVMFHEFVHKTDEELAAAEAYKIKKKKLKEARKREQAENIRKKKEKQEENKQRSMVGIMSKQQQQEEQRQKEEQNIEEPELRSEHSEDDDVEYYKKEVGQMPDADSFIPGSGKRKKLDKRNNPVSKKRKMDTSKNGDIKNKNKLGMRDSSKNKTGKRQDNVKKTDTPEDRKKKNMMTFMKKIKEKKKKKMKTKLKQIKKKK